MKQHLPEKKIFDIKVSNITKQELLEEIAQLVKIKKHAYVVTPYSEFIGFAKEDSNFAKIINQADISIADGVGISLALKYQKLPGIYWPMLKCLSALVLNRKYFTEEIKEKLSGSEAIYYVSEFAAKKGLSIFFLGGFDFGKGNTGDLAAEKLKEMYPKLKIAGAYAGSPSKDEESKIIKKINAAKPDLLYIAYGPRKQEAWIYRNKDKLKPCVSFCLGGSFDFVSGEKKRVPKWAAKNGLEGVLRPFFSERGNIKLIIKRIQRGWVGMYRFVKILIAEKKSKNRCATTP